MNIKMEISLILAIDKFSSVVFGQINVTLTGEAAHKKNYVM